jgi:CheY-like chemotaxis protein
VLRRLRQDPATEGIPVLIFTAYQVPRGEAHALQVPASMIMSKGHLSVARLRDAVRSALGAAPV